VGLELRRIAFLSGRRLLLVLAVRLSSPLLLSAVGKCRIGADP
jgi:hypothetical protein